MTCTGSLCTKMINYLNYLYKTNKCTITTGYNYIGQESWHNGYMDKSNEKYKNDYCQNVLKMILFSLDFISLRGLDKSVVGKWFQSLGSR